MTPTNIVIASMPSSNRVVAAFLLLGFLNAGTPLLIASTPVSAVQPEENARSTRNTVAAPPKLLVATTPKCALSARKWVPVAMRMRP